MENFYSKKNKNILVFSIVKKEEIKNERINLSPEDQFLQASICPMQPGKIINAHKHLESEKKATKSQEAWLVYEGLVEVKFYDLDSSFLCSRKLKSGDLMILFNGGHKLEILEKTILFEFKNGPYFGSEREIEYFNV